MSSAAQTDILHEPETRLGHTPASAAALKQFAAERLAAHRIRRPVVAPVSDARDEAASIEARVPGAARVREAVAARYQQSLSYHEFLAAEAERSMQQARAEAEIAARNAEAVETAQTLLLEELRQWRQPTSATLQEQEPALKLMERLQEAIAPHPVAEAEMAAPAVPHIAPRLVEPLEATLPQAYTPASLPVFEEDVEEMRGLDAEIAFRLDPEFAEHHIEPLPLQANILEFPRQLVAARKVRPRLAEGPMRDFSEGPLDGDAGLNSEYQLRIFEVESDQIATAPEPMSGGAPEWQSLELSATPAAVSAPDFVVADFAAEDELSVEAPAPYNPAQSAIYTQPVLNAPLHSARLGRRILSGMVDACCMAAAAIGFACLAMVTAGPSLMHLSRPMLGGLTGASLLVLYVVYHLLFFSFADATPGMRYAHVDFCTFANGNPDRAALRRRIWLTLLAAAPLGLGLLWMVMDYDHVGWHDRMSKMYPREY